MGFSCDTFYRYKAAVEEEGIENLLDKSRSQPNLKNRVDESIEKRVVTIAEETPAMGQQRMANELRNEGLVISPAGVRCYVDEASIANLLFAFKGLGEESG